MEKLIFLIEHDEGLRANITELLKLEGFQVVSLSSREARSLFKSNHSGLVMFNALTLEEPVDEFISFLTGKVDGIAVLCSDDESPLLVGTDIKIPLPFNYYQLVNQLSAFINTKTASEV